MDLPFYREYDLPWTTGKDQEKKFQRLLGITFLVAFVLGIVGPDSTGSTAGIPA